MAEVLIVDDNETTVEVLKKIIQKMGHNISSALTLKKGLYLATIKEFDVVMLDVRLPDGNGIASLAEFQNTPSNPEVIIMTGYGDADGAELAIRSGAWDYIEKPASLPMMTLPIIRALQYRETKKQKNTLKSLKREGIVGRSPQLDACLDFVAKASVSDANALIRGESGTGKELIARAIHENSIRSHKNLVVADCASLPVTLLEGILFGDVRHTYSLEDKARSGLFQQADRGTILVKDIEEISLGLQRTLLRVLTEGHIRPVGSRQDIKTDCRLIVTTKRDLEEMASEGLFLPELLARLQSLTLEIPPLRERREDILEVALYHSTKICKRYGMGVKGFAPDFVDVLMAYNWPGNIRELINIINSSVIIESSEELRKKSLPHYFLESAAFSDINLEDIPL
ncbi:MAG: sigma-54-dependent Fis family transcriptional regulator, partial [Syntrophaceae bacterium]|nr:sigma-54-dependent Fis family transcriptional regulator [Syntrophaceae bacterium]